MFRYTKKTLAIEIVVLIAVAIMLLPFWILLMGSLKTLPDILSSAAVAPPTPGVPGPGPPRVTLGR